MSVPAGRPLKDQVQSFFKQANSSALAQEVGLRPFQDGLLDGHGTLQGLGSATRRQKQDGGS